MMVAVVVVFDTRMIVVAIQAAERKFRINFVFGFYFVGIMANVGDDLMNFLLRYLFGIIDDVQILGFAVPGCQFNAGAIKGGFNSLLAHAAVPVNFNAGLNGF